MHIFEQSDGRSQDGQMTSNCNVCRARRAGSGRSRVRLALQNRTQCHECDQVKASRQKLRRQSQQAEEPRTAETQLGGTKLADGGHM